MASSAEGEEIERLIVRLIGDAENYLKMLTQAQEATKKASHEIEGAAHKFKELAEGVEHFGSSLSSAVKSAVGFEALEKMFEAFEKEEMVMLKLEATLKANGREVETLVKDYEEFAEGMSQVTTESKKAVLSITQAAESFGLTGDAAKAASREALGLSKMTGGSAEAMLRLTSAMAKGDVATAQHFARLVPQLRHVKDEAEFVAKYAALVGAGLEFAGKEAETTGGLLKQLANASEELAASFGSTVSSALKPFVTAGMAIIGVLKEMPSDLKTAVVLALALTAGFMAWSVIGPMVVSQIVAITSSIAAMAATMTASTYITNIPLFDFGKILMGGAALLGIAALGAGIVALGQHIVSTNAKFQALLESIEKLESASRSFGAAVSESTAKSIGHAKDMATFGSPEDAKAELDGQLKMLEEFHEQQKSMTEKAMEERHSAVLRFAARQLDIPQATESRIKESKEAAALLAAEISKVKQALGMLDPKHVGKVKDEMKEASISAKKLEESLRAQISNMGLDDNDKKIAALAAKGVPTGRLEDLSKQAKDVKENSESAKALKEHIKGLQFEADTLNLSKAEAEVAKFAKAFEGSEFSFAEGEAAKKKLKDLHDQIDAQKEAAKNAEEEKRKVDSILKNSMSPLEKQKADMDELDELLRVGALSLDEYAKAAKHVTDNLHKMNAEQAAAASSAESLTRQSAFFEHIPNMAPTSGPGGTAWMQPRGADAEAGMFGRNQGLGAKLDAIKRSIDKKPVIQVKEAGL